MAIYHFSAQVIGRSAGRSSVAAAAYRAGAKMVDERTGEIHDFTRKGRVFHDEIMAPPNVPAWMCDRSALWNHVEQIERRKDAQLCREFNVALPRELARAEQLSLARDFVQRELVDKGMVVQLNLHDLEGENPHFHAMVTTRVIEGGGFGKKERDWNSKEQLQVWRETWADLANVHLELAGFTERIDHRSLKDQGVTMRKAAPHLGPHATAIERCTGQPSRIREDRQQVDRSVMVERAREAVAVKRTEAHARARVHGLQTQIDQARREMAFLASAEHSPAELAIEAAMIERAIMRRLEGVSAVVCAARDLGQAMARCDLAATRLESANLVHQEAGLLADKAQRGLARWSQEHAIRAWLHRLGFKQGPLVKAIKEARDAAQAMQCAARQVHQMRQQYSTAVTAADQARNRLDQVRKVEIEALRHSGLIGLCAQVKGAGNRARQRVWGTDTKPERHQREPSEIVHLVEQVRCYRQAQEFECLSPGRSHYQIPRER